MAADKSLAAEIEAVLTARVKAIRIRGQRVRFIEDIPALAAEIAALQGRAFEDGARIGLRDHRAVTLRRMHARAERMMQTAYRAGNSTDGAIYREEVDALMWVLAALPLQPEGESDA